MLTELAIKNFAIIEEQSIHFAPGLNVLSGQTGSGKSIILNALELILGTRPREHFIREGFEQLEIEAHFNLSEIAKALIDELPDIAQGEELILARTLNRNGKGKIYINGRIGTVSLLEEISQKLINICGQGQHVRLLDSTYHLALIDEYSGNESKLSEYLETYKKWEKLRDEQRHLTELANHSEQRRKELEEVVAEIKPTKVVPGLRSQLDAELRRQESSERISEGLELVLQGLGDEEGVLARLSGLGGKLNEILRFDPSLKKMFDSFYSIRISLQEFENDLSAYLQKLVVDEQALEKLRDRLAEIARLERKHHTNDAGLCEILQSAESELGKLSNPDQLKELNRELTIAEENLSRKAEELSRARERGGAKLVKAVETDLHDLNMKEARLKLEITKQAWGSNGADRIEILISTNRGEPFKPLRQIASGGELSRIMLVLKKNLRDKSGVNVLVFDEVDTGISGAVARAVGEKLKALSRHSQVICITHLAQVASLADHHLLVDKLVGKRTKSIIRTIEGEEKVDEIARMLAGYQLTAASRESARELLSSNK